jgi:hypothetical protein
VRQRSAGFFGEDAGKLLKTDLEVLGSVDIMGDIGTAAPGVLHRATNRLVDNVPPVAA